CVNGKAGNQPVPLLLLNEGPYHSDIYDYWEYVRAFMAGGPEAIFSVDDKHSRTKKPLRKMPFFLLPFAFVMAVLLFFFFKPVELYLWLNPWKKKWPKEVHEWTGETINWH
ncbi:MAG: hypothetical protein OIF55_08640, partial [Amphritea sp.]|nr:hypothetical protein [Amphritea sp.]